jgi:hypothetical protein
MICLSLSMAGWLISAADFSLLSAAWRFLFDKFDRAERFCQKKSDLSLTQISISDLTDANIDQRVTGSD